MNKPGIIIVPLSTVKSLPDKERAVLRNYVMGGSKTEVRYRDEPEVRKILFGEQKAQQPNIATSDGGLTGLPIGQLMAEIQSLKLKDGRSSDELVAHADRFIRQWLLDRDKAHAQPEQSPTEVAEREELARALHATSHPNANFVEDRPECQVRLREADYLIAKGWHKVGAK